jgi:diguanylate cyclase (GGDEF)-like protein/PAS domain S-box-containing protein
MGDLTLRPQDLGVGRLLRKIRDAVVVADSTTGRILLWNQAASRIFGYSSSETLGLHVEELIPGCLEASRRVFMACDVDPGHGAYVDHPRELLELPAVRKGGEEITVEVSLNPIEPLDWHGEVGERSLLAIVRDATERKQTHDRLVESERRFATVLSNARAYVYRCLNEPGWANEFASDYALELTGYPPEELLIDGEVRLGDLIVEEDRQRVWDEVQAALERHERFEVRYVIRRKDGALRHVEDCGQGVYDEKGNVVALEGILYDVTEAALAEERLEEAEARYRQLVERLPAIVYLQKTNGSMSTIYDSPHIETLLGYPKDKYLEDPYYWAKILHPDDRERVLAGERRAIASGEPLSQEYRVVAGDGRIVWVRDEAVIVKERNGEQSYLQGLIFDITERKEAERRLQEAEARYRTLVEQIPAVVYIQELEHQGAISYISPQIREMMGYSAEDYLQDPDLWVRTTHPDDRERVLAEDARTDETGEPFRVEFRKITRDGRVIWVRDEAVLVRDADGRPLHWQGIFTDITERMRTEQALRESEQRYRTLVQYGSDIMTILEADGTIRYESPAVERVLGYRSEEMIGTDAFDYVHPDDLDSVLETFLEGIATKRPTAVIEFRFRHADGSWRYLEAIGVNLLEDPAVRGVMVNSRDITERKRAEEARQRSEAGLAEAQRMAHLGSWEWNVKTGEAYWSDEVFRIYGFEPRSVTPSLERLMEVVHPDDRARLRGAIDGALHRGETHDFDHRIVRPSGETRVVHRRAEVVFDKAGVPFRMVGTVQDITELKRTERALEESEQRFRQLFEQSVDALFVHDERGRFVDCNSQACRLLGYSREELLDLSVSDVSLNVLAGEERKARQEGGGTLWQRALAGAPGTFALSHEEKNVRKDGTVFPVEVRVGSVDYGGRRMILASVRDITERKLFEAQLTYQALHDPLTRLPNRTLFLDRLEHALAQTRRRQNFNVAVLFMDLDDFKNVNDSLGHDVGDELLKAVGTRLKSLLRPGDTAARLGGDEFAILLEDVRGIGDASLIARRIIEDIKAPFELMGHELFFTVSIGISMSTSERDRAEEMLRDADLAMYQAKEKGKATYQVFDSAMYGRVLDRLSLDRDLRRACRRDEFVIHYQPKVRLQTGRIFAVEALVRWDRPGRGLVLPEEFVPVAEENDLIVPIGRRTLDEACRRASEWRERYPNDLFEMVSVNLSASQLQHANLLEETVATLHRTGLDPRNLNLEITESVVMSDVPTNAATLDKLRKLGIELAIDDFGKGYSSLSYLKRFPVSYLKVDRSFVEELREGSEDRALVSGIIALAHTLGMQVIAEGVESAEQLRILREVGCDMAQGFYFSEPLTHDGMSALLDADPRW